MNPQQKRLIELMITQQEVAEMYDVNFQYVSRCLKMEETPRGLADFIDSLTIMDSPTLMRAAKFRRLARQYDQGNQTANAEFFKMTQGKFSLFIRGKQRITLTRWHELLERLEISEPETTAEDVQEVAQIHSELQNDEGYQANALIAELGLKKKDIANELGISFSTLTAYLSSERFDKKVRIEFDRAVRKLS